MWIMDQPNISLQLQDNYNLNSKGSTRHARIQNAICTTKEYNKCSMSKKLCVPVCLIDRQ